MNFPVSVIPSNNNNNNNNNKTLLPRLNVIHTFSWKDFEMLRAYQLPEITKRLKMSGGWFE